MFLLKAESDFNNAPHPESEPCLTDPASASVPEEGQTPAWMQSGVPDLGQGQLAE